VKELGRSEVADVNMPELTHSSSRNILAMFGLKCRCTALHAWDSLLKPSNAHRVCLYEATEGG